MGTLVRCLGGALFTGALLTLSLPLSDRGYFAWIALVPLLVATRGRGFLVGFIAALASIFVGAGVAVSGVAYPLRSEGSDAWLYTGYGLFGFAFAVTVALWADTSAEKRPVWWFAAVATLLESVLLVELPAHLALTQYRTQPVVMLASLVGIWGISTLLWWANLSIARMSLKSGAITGLALVTLGFGLEQVALPSPGGDRVRIGAVQTEDTGERSLTEMHLEASRQGAEVVVWPEFAGMAIARREDASALLEIARLPESSPFVTSFQDAHAPLPHNVAAIFSTDGESARYEKRRLFGAESKMHTPGEKAVSAVLSGRTYGLNICFDSCFPSVIRDTARLPNVSAILLPTIDPPSRHNFIAAMHASYSPFRAAEQGVPIIRADGYAYSSFVDGNGRILRSVPPGEAVAVHEVPVGQRFSPVRLLGDWWLLVCGIAFVLPLVNDFRSRGKAVPTETDAETGPG